MTRRERFECTMKHKTVDRVPMDFAGTRLTTVTGDAYFERLAKEFGMSVGKNYEDTEKVVLDELEVDFRCVGDVLKPVNFRCQSGDGWYTDGWGIKRAWTGYYYDIVEYPLKASTIEELENYEFPDISEINLDIFNRLQAEAKELYENSDYVVVAGHPVYGVMELGCWMCGYDDFLYKMLAEPEFVERFYEKVYCFQEQVIIKYYTMLGKYIHVTTSGDDFGSQTGPLISPTIFREQIKPWMKKRIALTKSLTDAYFFHHTCGSTYRLLNDLIDCGIDIINPIQPSAFEMEPERLKNSFGGRVAFWGGIDEQKLLTTGTPEEIKKEVFHVLNIIGKDGGYVVAPSHNVQVDVPPRNIIAMYRAVKDYYGCK